MWQRGRGMVLRCTHQVEPGILPSLLTDDTDRMRLRPRELLEL